MIPCHGRRCGARRRSGAARSCIVTQRACDAALPLLTEAVRVGQQPKPHGSADRRRGAVNAAIADGGTRLRSRTLGSCLASVALSASSVGLQPPDLCCERSVGHRRGHRVRHRRQGRSLVQCRRLERHEVRGDRASWPNGTDCGKPGLGIVLRDVEPGTPVNIEPAMRAFAERRYDVIIGIGFAQAPISNRSRRTTPTSSLRSSTA